MKIFALFIILLFLLTKHCISQCNDYQVLFEKDSCLNISQNNEILKTFKSNFNNYENLVFEGSGQAGIIYVGCVIELEKMGILDSVKNVAGTSSGAVISMLLALGYNAKEIQKMAYNINNFKMKKGGWWIFGGIFRMKKRYGWYKPNNLIDFFESVIKEKTGSTETTFSQLHKLSVASNYKFKDLYTIGINLNKQKKEIFSYKDFPNMPIKNALIISCSIPYYFESIGLNKNGELTKPNDSCDIYIDGGVSGIYPIDIFDEYNLSFPRFFL